MNLLSLIREVVLAETEQVEEAKSARPELKIRDLLFQL